MTARRTWLRPLIIVGLLVFGADILVARLADRSIRHDGTFDDFIARSDRSAKLREDEIMSGRYDCEFGTKWQVYRYKLCLRGNASGGPDVRNSIFQVMYWAPRPFLHLISQDYYFDEPYGAETVEFITEVVQE
jgi:hypothetical protein